MSLLGLFIRWHIRLPGQMKHLIFVKPSCVRYLSHNYVDIFSIPARKKKTLGALTLASVFMHVSGGKPRPEPYLC